MRRLIPFRKQNKLPLYNTEEERAGLRAAGRFNGRLMDFLREQIRAGVTTNQLDRLADEFTRDHGHVPACLGYNGFPKSICTSVNDVVCHGIPNEEVLRPGDIVNVDCTTIVDGWYGDSSETFLIEPVSPLARKLVQASFDALWLGIRAIRPYSSVMEIGLVISRFGWKHGFGVVENFQGHGIGRMFHQDPGIPHVPVRKSKRDLLAPGVSFTIEPMFNAGTKTTRGPLADGWTILTDDGALSAQFEHQILMTEDGPEILTRTDNGPQAGHVF
ncbi:type I methionyl aminopeptidase [Planctomicrobium piriforme]|uniref:Methionine aminopeptidase n=1 Tax=Planctomicrobium piriforme TaxID=1576369 RepID=A0A1I3QEZ2_9PLAN|nr:type I methionyl aminopeptidase [Planctomicrobium piriforme]SFJ32099.1 methionyl aminopeptidase [Planctomicrobium piriforme]